MALRRTPKPEEIDAVVNGIARDAAELRREAEAVAEAGRRINVISDRLEAQLARLEREDGNG